MSTQRIVWIIAAMTAILAALVLTARKAGERAEDAHVAASDRRVAEDIGRALDLLREDPAMDLAATRLAIETAAEQVEQSSEKNAEGLYLLGLWYADQRRLELAEQAFRDAIALRGDWAWPHNSLGILLANMPSPRWEEAEASFRTAIRLDSHWSRPHNDLAILLRLLGRADEAEPEALKALELAPEDVASHNNYANLLVVLHRYSEAGPHYEKATELDPNHPKPYYNLGCLYALQGKADDAIPLLEKAFQRDPSLLKDAPNDPDLQPLQDDPRFKALLEDSPS